MSSSSLWQRFQQHFLYYRDLSRHQLDEFPNDFFVCLLGGQTDSNETEELQKDKVGDLIGS
jgi:hypothetical protein